MQPAGQRPDPAAPAATMGAAAYPAYREATVVLRDGSTVHVRPLRAQDESSLVGFLRALSEESRTLRFFSASLDLAHEAARESQVDYRQTFGLLALAGPSDRVVAHALYVATSDQRAEVAFAIADEYQGRGLGSILLAHLAQAADANGIREFVAVVLPQNHRMLSVFRDSGFPAEVRSGFDEVRVTFPTSLTDEALEQFERREQVAAANALRAVLAPRSVAVIGASRQRGTVGAEVFHNLLASEFSGPVFPVNPAAAVVQSVLAYPSIEAVPGPVDLAVVAVPAPRVTEVAEACGRKGVRALVVLSTGFGEHGEEGQARQAELLRICRVAGMRLVGPNCLGVANTDPAVRLNALVGPAIPPPGRIGFASQSGALGLAALDLARSRGLGISSFVSMGNKADMSGNDLLNYWEDDPNTDLVLLYLESFGNPRKFARIARRLGRRKPIIAVKSGRSAAGPHVTSSHTGAMLAASDVTVEALFRQSGVIRADTLQELLNAASLLASQPLPRGRRVAIVTNVRGPAILCADACEAHGLELAALSEETQAKLRAVVPVEASIANPLDMLASATPDPYAAAIRALAADPDVDAVIAIFLPPLATHAEDVARAILEAARSLESRAPVLSVFISALGVPAELADDGQRIPTYTFPEEAAIALAHAARYAEWRARPPARPPHLEGLDRDAAAGLVADALGRGGGWLEPAEVERLLRCYGLPLVERRTATSPEQAGSAAEQLDGVVALKAIAPGVRYKTELGAVRLGLRGADEVRNAAQHMQEQLAAAGYPPSGYVVQRMAEPGAEMFVGVVHDTSFGPVVACGASGAVVEVLTDVSVRLTPLTREDAADMVRELRSYPLLTGFRGGPPRDVAALEDVLLRLSALVEDLPHVAELDCNPVLVAERGACVVDARIRIEPGEPPRPLGARR